MSLAQAKRLIIEPRDESRISEIRRTMIGGTDIAPILGVSEKRTRFAVWAAKVNADVTPDEGDDDFSEAGIYLEPFILRRFAERLKLTIQHPLPTYRLARTPFLGANPDAVVRNAQRRAIAGVDAKSRSPFVRHLWGDPGSGDVPPDEMCQGQWYMEICDIGLWYFPVLFDRKLEVFVLRRDRELGKLMVDEATAFWETYVVPRKEPPFEGPVAADYLRRKYPFALVPPKEAEPRDVKLVEARERLKKTIDQLELKLDAIEGELKSRIGDAEGLMGDGWKATWYEKDGAQRTDWKAVVTELRSFPIVADPEAAAAVHETIEAAIRRYTSRANPTRVLRVTFKGPRAVPDLEPEPATAALAAKETT